MKTLKNLLILSLVFTMTLVSCGDDDSPAESCAAPTNLAVSDFLSLSKVNLTWTEGADEIAWEIEYGLNGFTQGQGVVINATSNDTDVNGLNSTQSFDFYVRSICATDDVSSWVGPVTVEAMDEGQTSTTAFMNANINATQYNNMRPFGYLFNQRAVFVRTYLVGNDEHKFMNIQGNNMPGQISQTSTKEVNIELRIEDWGVGSYPLGTDASDDGVTATSFMNLVYFDGSTDTTQEIGGSVTITEFDEVNRMVKGNFTYTFNRVSSDGTMVNGPLNCDGNFEFSLDDPEFD